MIVETDITSEDCPIECEMYAETCTLFVGSLEIYMTYEQLETLSLKLKEVLE